MAGTNRKVAKKKIRGRLAQNRGARNSQRKNKKYLAWNHLTCNQKEVAKRIMAGNYRMLKESGWGFLDKFFIFLKTIGFFLTLDVDGEGYQRRIITIAKLLLTYNVKILLGISSMNQVPDLLFGDIGLLMLIGYTAEQIRNGVCNRGKGKRKPPIHKNTLADALDKFSPQEVEHILNEGIKILARLGFIKDSVYIADASDLKTTEKYEGAGSKTVKEKHLNKRKQVVEIEVTYYGWKLILIKAVESRIIVAAKVVKINQHENNYLLDLIQQAQENIGKRKIRILLIDRGFIDGLNLWKIKHSFRIDFIIPAKTDMSITADARSLRKVKEGEGIYRASRKGLTVMGIEGLTSYDGYGNEAHQEKNKTSKNFRGNPLNVAMVVEWEEKVYPAGEEKVFLTTLPVSEPLKIIDNYELRSLVENCIFRELKQGWLIGKFPKKTERAVISHTMLTLCMFNLTNAYRSELGQSLTEKGIRRFRLQTLSETRNKVVIIAGEYYGIFDLEELAILWGRPPQEFWSVDPEEFNRRYGLK